MFIPPFCCRLQEQGLYLGFGKAEAYIPHKWSVKEIALLARFVAKLAIPIDPGVGPVASLRRNLYT
jgi:hypothetical protein